MKYLVDMERLVDERILTESQAAEIRRRSREGLSNLSINILLVVGVISVVIGLFMWALSSANLIILGAVMSIVGISAIFNLNKQFDLVANAVAFIGVAAFLGGLNFLFIEEFQSLFPAIFLGIIVAGAGYAALLKFGSQHRFIFSSITVFGFATHIAGIVKLYAEPDLNWLTLSYIGVLLIVSGTALNNRFVSALSVIAFASALAATGYWEATYGLAIYEPTLTIIQFGIIATICLVLSQRLDERYARHSRIIGLLSFIWINMAMWIGSLWGDIVGMYLWGPVVDLTSYADTEQILAFKEKTLVISDIVFAVLWFFLIFAVGFWSAITGRRKVFNAAATFGAIHLYTQWFERFSMSALSLILLGVVSILIAWGVYQLNTWYKARAKGEQVTTDQLKA